MTAATTIPTTMSFNITDAFAICAMSIPWNILPAKEIDCIGNMETIAAHIKETAAVVVPSASETVRVFNFCDKFTTVLIIYHILIYLYIYAIKDCL